MPTAAPDNPLAAHIGNGTVFIRCDKPTVPVDGYEIVVALDVDGPYFPFSNATATTNVMLLYAIPVAGQDIFIKLRAFKIVDGVKQYSSYVNVKRGTLTKPTIAGTARALSGSRIPNGAIFSILTHYDRVAAFKVTEEVEF